MNKIAIENLLTLKRGYDLTKNEMNNGDYPVVGSNGIIGFHDAFNVMKPCVTVGRSGTVGAIHYYNQDCWVHNTCLYIEDYKGNNPLYLYYLLKNIDLTKVATSTGVPTLNRNFVHPLTVFATNDVSKQNIIVSILEILDKKIEVNKKTTQTLESLAKTIYDYWFLQFEFPNEEGKPYKSSGGKMIWNEELKREIPEGWIVQNLIDNSLCKPIKNGLAPFETKCYLPTGNIDGENIVDGEYVTPYNRESRANMQPSKYSVWFAKMKNSIKHISIPNNSDWFIEKYILSTGMEGLQCTQETFAYIHSLINSSFFENRKDVLAHGATQESVNDQDLKNIKILIPDSVSVKKYSTMVNPYLEMKFSLFKQNQQLTELRDFLLPMLMNGQVTFKDEKNI